MKLYTTDKTVAVVFNDTREIWETAMRMLQLDDGYRVLFFGDRADDDSKELLDTPMVLKLSRSHAMMAENGIQR